MSKKVVDTSGFDHDYIIGQADRSNRAKPDVVPEEMPQSIPEPKQEAIPEEIAPTGQLPKEESKRKKNKLQEYESLFFKVASVKTRSGKVVYIRPEYHDRILKIVRVIGENDFSLFSYLDNLLEHHFNTFQDEITELYDKKNTGVF